jgi:predicted nicotinamide N-methyase
MIADIPAFIRANTRVLTPPHTPEIKLHLADDAVSLWELTEEKLGELGLPPPFWAFAWAGGQALARHLLDHPEIARGKAVLDVASGSGLVAIAAMQAGATSARGGYRSLRRRSLPAQR